MAEPDDPLVINVVGRHKEPEIVRLICTDAESVTFSAEERENQDLQGEYHMKLECIRMMGWTLIDARCAFPAELFA